MKNKLFLLLMAIMAVVLSSCRPDTPSFQLEDLQGLWQRNNTNEFVRFTTEQSDEAGYLYGREWNEDEDVHESDLYVYVKDQNGQDSLVYGNGWFKYKFASQGDLTEIHLMENGGAEIPKEYVVDILTDSHLEYHQKEYTSIKYYFNKVAETAE